MFCTRSAITVQLSVLVTGVLTLASSNVASASPFTPDRYSLTTQRSYLEVSGTNTACFFCEDADTANDVVLSGELLVHVIDVPLANLVVGGGSFSLTAENEIVGEVSSRILTDVTLYLWDGLAPELVSVTHGTFVGFVNNFGVSCCDGGLNTMAFGGASLFYPFEWPFVTGVSTVEILLDGPTNPVFTPEPTAVPEPASLLLLGSGLIGAEWKRRRRSRRLSPPCRM